MAMTGDKPWPQVPVGNKEYNSAAVVIIGAGISGLCTAIDLLTRNACANVIILEKSAGLGGTWRDNRYPGCCCDVWSHLYSYSFSPNSSWTREYPGQEEILSYLQGVAHQYQLYRYIRFNTAVSEAVWNEETHKWGVEVEVLGGKEREFVGEKGGYRIEADFLVSAVGQLNVPRLPEIEGLEGFKGKVMHSARWDWTFGLEGKRAAIIGNGATAAQIIPEIVKEVSSLTIHQRTPNWIIPRLDAPIAPWKRSLYKWVPPIRQRKRADMMDFRESFYDAVTDGESAFAKMLEDAHRQLALATLPDKPELREKLEPKYKVGCKRVIITDDYFPVFNRDNVRLETGKIDRITEKGIVTDGKEEEYDLLVLATGFRTVEFMHPIKIIGKGGKSLADVWSEGGQALYGVSVEAMPNFGMLYGPNTNLGHNSIILMIEAQSKYINGMIGEVLAARTAGKSLAITPREARLAEFNAEIQTELNNSSFADPNCNSWYKRADNGKITQNWSRNVVDYQKILSKIDWSDYELEGSGAGQVNKDSNKKIGRVVEETTVSYQTMGLTALGLAAVGVGALLRNSGRLRLR